LGIDPFSEARFRSYEFLQDHRPSLQVLRDFLTRPRGVLVSEPLARRLGLQAGDILPVAVGSRQEQLEVVGVFRTEEGLYPLEGGLLLMDIAWAQELLDRVGRLDYIDILGSDSPEFAQKLKQALPPGVEVSWPGAQAKQMEGLVSSYRLNLSVLSAIALFVGMFLIYQSVTLSVVRRRREIGLLRTLGMAKGQVLALFLAEGAVSGLVGGLVGLGLGVITAQAVLGFMSHTLTSLYTPVEARELALNPPLFAQAWGLALGATLLAALIPAWEAAQTKVRAVWHREELEERLEGRAGLLALAGLAALLLAGVLSVWKTGAGPPVPGFAAAFLILLAFALFTPLSARVLGRLAAPPFRHFLGPAGDLGCRYLSGSLSRSAVSIAALACALGLLIAVAVMIGSFRQTVDRWVTRSISGDIFLGPAIFSTAAYDDYLPPEIVAELRRDPEVDDIYLYRCVRIPFRDRFINSQGVVVISEPLASTFGYREGDTLVLPTPSGDRPLTVAGVFYDYRTDGPSIWMDLRQFRRFWQDTHLNAVRLYLKDKSRIRDFQQRLQKRYGRRYRLLALSHAELRRGILKIFDDTFALTYALEGVAVVVAVFGIITTFLVLIMDRERELALLQALGASRRQIMGMVLVESGLASVLSFLLGAAAGSLLALLLILVINKQAFGWTIRLFFTPGIYWQRKSKAPPGLAILRFRAR